MADDDRLLVDLVVAAPPPVVWAALREPEQIARWFGWNDGGLAAEIELIFVTEPTADDQALTLTWPDGDRIVLEPHEVGTRLLLSRAGHTGHFDGAYDAVDEGWISFTHQLRFALERHPNQHRRTISAHGLDLGPLDDPLMARLGLRLLGDDPVGGRYEVTGPNGFGISGEVSFQTDLQLGLTVEQEGDALLVVARTPPAAAPPDGAVTLVLSTFGLDDARFAEAQRRWSAWWSTGEGDPDADPAPAAEG